MHIYRFELLILEIILLWRSPLTFTVNKTVNRNKLEPTDVKQHPNSETSPRGICCINCHSLVKFHFFFCPGNAPTSYANIKLLPASDKLRPAPSRSSTCSEEVRLSFSSCDRMEKSPSLIRVKRGHDMARRLRRSGDLRHKLVSLSMRTR